MDTGPVTRQYSGQTSNSNPNSNSNHNNNHNNHNNTPLHPPLIPQLSNKKRRTSTTGRGVANLTPEQLNKKRANDREAQRAIRERTKGQIESLEKKIHELTSQQPYKELQQALRQKELVESENEEIKKRLHAVLGIIEPMTGGNRILGRGSRIEYLTKVAANQSTTQDLFRLQVMSQEASLLFQRQTSMSGLQLVHTLRFTTPSLAVHRLHIPGLPVRLRLRLRLRDIHLLLSPSLRTPRSPVNSHLSIYWRASSIGSQTRNSMLDMCYRICKKTAIGDGNTTVTGHRRCRPPRSSP